MDAVGTLDAATYGNRVIDRREYDARQRLRRMSAAANGESLRDLEYILDGASRITSIVDHRVGVDPMEDLSFTELVYDDLYRLVGVTDRVGATQWTYDDVANVQSVTSTHPEPFLNITMRYGEDGSGPDQLTHWGDRAFDYDEAGRTTWDGERTLEWNADGRLMRVMRDGIVEEYVYGFDHERVLKRTITTTGTEGTRYIDRDVEERAGGLVRYVFLGTERIVRVDDVPDDPTSSAASVLGRPDITGATMLIALAGLLVIVVVTRRRPAVLIAAWMIVSCDTGLPPVRDMSLPIHDWPAGATLYLSDAEATPVVLADTSGAAVQHLAHHPFGAVRIAPGDLAEPYGYVGPEATVAPASGCGIDRSC
ncbi:MAG: hypothetical protein M3Q72_10550 [Actinomycetota bacterium]|nr:hypothetical protein [Myxococcota bacterium]MDQ3177965.1 hypothetical protein [Actinomycetota bacterium]